MSRLTEALSLLNSAGIPYELAGHRAVCSISECSIAEELLHALMPRNLFLCPRTQKEFYLLTAHPDSVFRTSEISKQAGSSRLSFGPEELLPVHLGCYPGSVSPLGLLFDKEHKVRFLLDEALLKEEYLLFHPLDNTASVKIALKDLLERILPLCNHDFTLVHMEAKTTDEILANPKTVHPQIP